MCKQCCLTAAEARWQKLGQNGNNIGRATPCDYGAKLSARLGCIAFRPHESQ